MAEAETFAGENGELRLKDAELVVPVVIGTASFHLGKKATEAASFRWTAYVRGLDNEDLSHILSKDEILMAIDVLEFKVIFTLHSSFQNPIREILEPPYELTEHGWGEFEILVELHFREDSTEKPVDIVHKLKLYPDDAVGQISKKAVVHEQLEELVFSEPVAAFHQRVSNQVSVPAHPYSVAAHFTNLSPDLEVQRYNAVWQKVAKMRANTQRQLDTIA